MVIHRIFAVILVLGLFQPGNAGVEELVVIGKHKAHNTRILAKYKSETHVQSGAVALQGLGLRVSRQYSLVQGLVLLDVADKTIAKANLGSEEQAKALADRIETLRKSGNFEFVQPDYAHFPSAEPLDSKYVDGTLWGLRNNGQNGGTEGADINVSRTGMNGTNAWDITTGSTNVIVAVIDTGIRYTHRDLAQQMWVNPGEIPGNFIDDDANGYIDDVHGINAILDSGDPMDDGDHGTHVAGTIGAAANDDNGHVGVAWKVRLMALKFIRSPEQGGFGLTSDAIQCLQYATSKRVKISNNSWGGGPFEDSMVQALDQARQANHLFIAAAGNSTLDADLDPAFPAAYDLDNVVSVAALDRKDQLATFSNYGRTSVDLGAPGVDIFSSTSRSDTDYQVFDGTSMAAPHVTGVAALCLAAYPQATLIELRERLVSTTIPVNSIKNKTASGGRVNALGALLATADGILEVSVNPAPGTVDQPAELLAGSRQVFIAKVSDLLSITNARFSATMINGVAATNLVLANDGRPPDLVSNDSTYTGYLFVPTNLGPMTLTYNVTAAGKKSTSITNYFVSVPGPINDMMTNATKIASVGGSVVGNNKFGSLEVREPAHADSRTVSSTVWWDWSPKVNGSVVVDTTGSAIDTVLGVYTGTSVGALKKVAAVDDVGTRKEAYLTFYSTAGETYHIAVGGSDTNAVGLIRLRVEQFGGPDTVSPVVTIAKPSSGLIVDTSSVLLSGTAIDPTPNSSGLQKVAIRVNNNLAVDATGTTNWGSVVQLARGGNEVSVVAIDQAGNVSSPAVVSINYRPIDVANDHLTLAELLTSSVGKGIATNTAATKEFGEPNHAGNNGGKSVWWRWVAPANGILKLSLKDSTFDTLLAVYTGARFDRFTRVASNDDAVEGSGYSELEVGVQEGTTYSIAADGFGGRSGVVRLSYSFETASLISATLSAGNGGSVTSSGGLYSLNSIQEFAAIADLGFDFFRWEGSFVRYEPILNVKMQSNIVLSAVFKQRILTDDLETGTLSKLPWLNDSAKPWTVVDGSGSSSRYALRSGKIGPSENSTLKLTINSRGGTGSFDYKVSSESAWDKLVFLIDGTEMGSWSGEVDWSVKKFNLAAGERNLEWRYSKDANNDSGLDSAFIDNLDLPVVVAVDPQDRPVLNIDRRVSGNVVITVVGQENQVYTVEATSDFSNWEVVSQGVAVNGVFLVNDHSAVAANVRYYRAVHRP